MAIRLSGMISGMDTDAMIEELVSAYSKKKDNIYRDQKSLTYKQDAWKALNTKIYSLYSGTLSSLRFSTNYNKKATSISDTTKATVSAANTAADGTQELQIKSLAKSGYLTGAKLNGDYSGSTKMSELGFTGSARINVTVNGKESYIDVTEDMTFDQFTTKIKDAGLNANFDAINGRFFISSKQSGASEDFSISGNNDAGNELLKNLGLYTVSTTDISAYKSYIDAAANDVEYINNLAKTEYLNGLLAAEKKSVQDDNTAKNKTISDNKASIAEKNNEISFAKSSDTAKDEALKKVSDQIDDLNEKITDKQAAIDAETDADKKATLQKELEDLQSQVTKAGEQKAKYEAIKAEVGSSEVEGFDEKVAAFEEGKKSEITTLTDANKAIEEEIKTNNEKITTIDETMAKDIAEKEAYLGTDKVDYSSAEYESVVAKYEEKLATAQSVVNDYNRYEELKALGNGASEDEKAELNTLSNKLGLNQSELGAVRITGSDAVIYLNGAKFESSTNNFSVNGLTITANALTADNEKITITTSNDVDGIYNMVKDFFKEYNTLINEMDSSYNAASAGDYKPLTEEEEGELSEAQLEKWEKKLKDAALRKDSTLNSIASLMKTAMSQGFEVDGETYTLSSFGIKTLGYFNAADNEKAAYHIDGDKDDKAVSGNEDKLRAAIANDPETFVSFFSQLTTNLYNKLNGKMSSSSLSSAYTVYNDKFMTKQYNEYKTSLSDWDEKIEKMRDKYVKQFAAMESALASLQGSQTQLSQLLGG